jgi:uncharacterized protein (DUF58 family)
LTARGAVALGLTPVSAVAGFLLGAEELVLLAVAIAVYLAVGLVQCAVRLQRAAGAWRLTVALESTDVPRRSPSLLTLRISAQGSGSTVPVRVEDPTERWELAGPSDPTALVSPRPPGPASAVHLPALTDGGSVTLGFNVPTEHRGIFTMTGVHLWCFDGLALFAGLVATGPSATVTVLPLPLPVNIGADLLQGALMADELPTPRAHRQRQDLGDFAGLRPYVPGDRLRLLYWPALARTGDLMVRDFEDTTSRRFCLVADVRPHLGRRGAEAVLAAAASAGLQALDAGAVVEFSTTDGQRFAVGPGPHAALGLLRQLAAIVVEPPAAPRRGAAGSPGAAPSLPAFQSRPVVLTTAGGANSLPGALGGGSVVVVA